MNLSRLLCASIPQQQLLRPFAMMATSSSRVSSVMSCLIGDGRFGQPLELAAIDKGFEDILIRGPDGVVGE